MPQCFHLQVSRSHPWFYRPKGVLHSAVSNGHSIGVFHHPRFSFIKNVFMLPAFNSRILTYGALIFHCALRSACRRIPLSCRCSPHRLHLSHRVNYWNRDLSSPSSGNSHELISITSGEAHLPSMIIVTCNSSTSRPVVERLVAKYQTSEYVKC